MNNLLRLAIGIFGLGLALLPIPAYAQGNSGTNTAAIIPPSIYYQPVASGTFADNGDQTYTLTLEEVPLEILRFENTPALKMRRVDTGGFATSWALVPDLSTAAVMDTEGLEIDLTLSAPAYDPGAGTLAFHAVVDQLSFLEPSKDKPTVPETFSTAHLSIAATSDFQMARATAIINVTEGIRSAAEPEPGCDAARVTLEQDRDLWRSLMDEAHTASETCQNGQVAGCTQFQTVSGSLLQVQGGLGDTIDAYSRDCRTWAMPNP